MMRDFNRVLVAIMFALFATATHGDTLTGHVVGISDGDTLTLLDATNTQHKIRLAGIDSPEKGQPFGQVCKQSLSDLAYGQTVQIDWRKMDRYGRVIGKVLVDSRDANLEQIRRGCGWHYKKYQNEQSLDDRLSYNAAEESGFGLIKNRCHLGIGGLQKESRPIQIRKTG